MIALGAALGVTLFLFMILLGEVERLWIERPHLIAELDNALADADRLRADNRRQAALIAALQSTPDALVLPFLPEQRRPGGAS